MARTISVEIIGDSRSLERAFARSEKSAQKFGRNMESVGRGTIAASVGFRGLGRAVGYASASFLGAAGFVAAAKAGFDEMLEGQKVAAQTAAAIKSTGAVAGVTAKQINTLAGSLQTMSGYDDEAIQSAENLMLTFTNVRNVMGKGNDVFNQATLATLNLSRTFDQDLSASAVQLGKALQDPVRGVTALRRIGVSFTEAQQNLINRLVRTGDVLGAQKIILQEVNRETGNAARAYGQTLPGQLDILKGNLSNLAGELAKTLNPELKKLTERFNKWLENPEHKKAIIEGFATAIRDVGAAFKFASSMADKAISVWKTLDRLKVKPLWNYLPKLQGPMGITLFGGPDPAAKTPSGLSGPVGKPGGSLLPPGLAGPVGRGAAPPGTVSSATPRGVTAAQRNNWFDSMIGRQIGRVQDITSLRGQIGRLQQIAGMIQQRIAATKDITRKLTLEDALLDVQRTIRGDQAQIADNAKQAAEQAAQRKSETQQLLLERLQLSVDKTGLTDTLQDDLKALKHQQQVIKEIIQTQGSTLALQQQLLSVEMAIKGTQGQIADQRRAAAERAKSAADAAKAAAKAAADEAKASAQAAYDAAIEARRSSQFVALGLLPSGDEPILLTDLKAQLAKARDAVKGTTLDTADLRKQLDGVAKVLSLKLGVPLYDVGQKIQQTLDDIIGKVKNLRGEVTQFRHMSSTGIIDALGLNLSAAQQARLRQGLTQMGAGGSIPHQGLQFSGAGARPGIGAGSVYNGDIHVHGVTDIREFERVMTKRTKSRAHTRRGP